ALGRRVLRNGHADARAQYLRDYRHSAVEDLGRGARARLRCTRARRHDGRHRRRRRDRQPPGENRAQRLRHESARSSAPPRPTACRGVRFPASRADPALGFRRARLPAHAADPLPDESRNAGPDEADGVADQRRPRPSGAGRSPDRSAARKTDCGGDAGRLRALPARARASAVLAGQRNLYAAPCGRYPGIARTGERRRGGRDAAHPARRAAAQPGQPRGHAAPMKITDVKAFPTSFPIPQQNRVALGIGTAVKRDAVVVKVLTDEGITGWGEAHHGRAHTAVARLIETTLRQLILNLDPLATEAIWEKLYRNQLASHGMGAGACLAISGIDMALWDIRGKALKLPLYRLLGGASKPIPAYAGGVSLGYQPEAELVAEARKSLDQGYRAIKLRLGDSPSRDISRMRAVRKAFGDDLVILTDANIGYQLEDVRRVMPVLDEIRAGWLEEPFPAHDYRSYREAKLLGRTPLAAGENHYTRFEFNRVIEDGAITILQPD